MDQNDVRSFLDRASHGVLEITEQFEVRDFLGCGSFGAVFEARRRSTNQTVALKLIKLKGHEVPLSLLRECHIMVESNHKNIVRMDNALVCDGFLYIVMEYLSMSLALHIERFPNLYPNIAKRFLCDLLSGLSYCHSNGIMHRDVKPANLLINLETSCLKLGDFGLGRAFISNGDALSPNVVSFLYKAPELLLGETRYTSAIDMWAAGCIFAEMVGGQPLFAGYNETYLLRDILSKVGGIREDMWPGVSTLPKWTEGFAQYPRDIDVAERFPGLDNLGCDLLRELLSLNPMTRISAKEALRHMYLLH